MMELCLLDTDILSEVLKGRNQDVTDNANAYLEEHGEFAISAFTHFEVVRGFRWQKATTKLAAFEQLCQTMTISSGQNTKPKQKFFENQDLNKGLASDLG